MQKQRIDSSSEEESEGERDLRASSSGLATQPAQITQVGGTQPGGVQMRVSAGGAAELPRAPSSSEQQQALAPIALPSKGLKPPSNFCLGAQNSQIPQMNAGGVQPCQSNPSGKKRSPLMSLGVKSPSGPPQGFRRPQTPQSNPPGLKFPSRCAPGFRKPQTPLSNPLKSSFQPPRGFKRPYTPQSTPSGFDEQGSLIPTSQQRAKKRRLSSPQGSNTP